MIMIMMNIGTSGPIPFSFSLTAAAAAIAANTTASSLPKLRLGAAAVVGICHDCSKNHFFIQQVNCGGAGDILL